MSLTRVVPAAVPSLFHSSTPRRPSSAAIMSVPLTFVRYLGKGKTLLGLGISLTRLVPAVVPSLFHSSRPVVPSSAVKNSVPFTVVRYLGPERESEPVLSGLMSLTREVPAAVPSLFHSSRPCVPSFAVKNSVPLTFASQKRPP